MSSEPGSGTPTVAIVGSGISGLGMGIALKRAGIDTFTIFEQAGALGGVWRENTYPGAACDVPSYVYSYSFEPKLDWSTPYSPQSEILAYLEHCARTYDITGHLRFDTQITAAEFDEDGGRWSITTAAGATLHADVLIAACGQLRVPSYPSIPGLERFAGRMFHAARWEHDYDLAGRRVAVIGTGATAIQVVPGIVDDVARLTLFQRTAPYMLRKRHSRYRPWEKALYRRLPLLQRARRLGFWMLMESMIAGFTGSRALMWPPRLVHELQLRTQIRDRRVRDALRPDYVIGCKRMGISSEYYRALDRPHAELVTEPIRAVTETGVITADGVRRDVDAIVLATGFRANEFVAPMGVRGRGGRDLEEAWSDGAEAYLGIAVSGFPNFFLLYGPNTNLGAGSIIHMVESQAHYVVQAVRALQRSGARYLDVRADVQDAFGREMQRRLRESVWTTCSNWYRDDAGRVVNNWPGFMLEYRRRTRRLHLADYEVAPARPARQAA